MSMLTKSSPIWKRGLIGSAVLFPLVLALTTESFGHATTSSATEETFLPGVDAPVQVRSLLQRACRDCHSNETRWPWYSKIPPVSWQIQEDVDQARAFMNFSLWNDYTPEERRHFLMDIANVAHARVMPPARYTWMHRDARLSDAELRALSEWALAESKRLRETAPVSPN